MLEELPLGDGKPVLVIGTADLLDLLAISPGALSGLKARGIAVQRGHGSYDLAATVRGYVGHLRETASGRGGEEHVTSLTAERARLARAQAEGAELKNAERRGELVAAAEVERGWSDLLRGLRSRLLAVPSRARAQLAHLAAADIEVFDREIRAALVELGGDDAND